MSILVTGGFGFIGRNLIKHLDGEQIIILDNLDKQVHGPWLDNGEYPSYARTHGHVKFYFGKITDYNLIKKILTDNKIGCIIHLASSVGVGQSMYEIVNYCKTNDLGTATLWQAINDIKPKDLKKFVVASSMAIYGEGPVINHNHPTGGMPIKADENLKPDPTSVYAIQKLNQERMCLVLGKALDIKTYALRLFNVYGPMQSLNNPYTGVLAIFGSAIINNKQPIIYEDGEQSRDFIHVEDICEVFKMVIDENLFSGIYNVGTGVRTSIIKIHKLMCENLDKPDLKPIITHKHRKGDIRHCFANITKIEKYGYKPKINIESGLKDYCYWLKQQKSINSQIKAHSELINNDMLEN